MTWNRKWYDKLPVFSRNLLKSVFMQVIFLGAPLNQNENLYTVIWLCKVYYIYHFYITTHVSVDLFLLKMDNLPYRFRFQVERERERERESLSGTGLSGWDTTLYLFHNSLIKVRLIATTLFHAWSFCDKLVCGEQFSQLINYMQYLFHVAKMRLWWMSQDFVARK
jgi:hypothetical protein